MRGKKTLHLDNKGKEVKYAKKRISSIKTTATVKSKINIQDFFFFFFCGQRGSDEDKSVIRRINMRKIQKGEKNDKKMKTVKVKTRLCRTESTDPT